jgi:hypothetical protein
MLKQRVRELAVRPVDGGEGQSGDKKWEEELSATVDKLDKRNRSPDRQYYHSCSGYGGGGDLAGQSADDPGSHAGRHAAQP